MRLMHPLIVSVLCAGLSSAEVTLFEGTAGGVGNVAIHDEAGLSAPTYPAALQGIRLLPIDFVGRAALTELLQGEPLKALIASRRLICRLRLMVIPSIQYRESQSEDTMLCGSTDFLRSVRRDTTHGDTACHDSLCN